MKVFVYGTLLSGLGNNHLLQDSIKLGITKSPKLFNMLDLGWFPGLILDDINPIKIKGEVYEINDDTLKRLDRLEGYDSTNPSQGLYNRIEIDTEFGKAFVYIYNNRYKYDNKPKIDTGDWKNYIQNYK